jgi:hypothetical protein
MVVDIDTMLEGMECTDFVDLSRISLANTGKRGNAEEDMVTNEGLPFPANSSISPEG